MPELEKSRNEIDDLSRATEPSHDGESDFDFIFFPLRAPLAGDFFPEVGKGKLEKARGGRNSNFWKGRGRAGLTRFGKAWTGQRVSQAFQLLSSRVLIGGCISCTAHRLRFRIPEPLRFDNRTRSSLSHLGGFSTSLWAVLRASSCLNQAARELSPPFTTQSDLLSFFGFAPPTRR